MAEDESIFKKEPKKLSEETIYKDIHKIAMDVNILAFLVVLDTIIMIVMAIGLAMSS